jgi:hypothetical protein
MDDWKAVSPEELKRRIGASRNLLRECIGSLSADYETRIKTELNVLRDLGIRCSR